MAMSDIISMIELALEIAELLYGQSEGYGINQTDLEEAIESYGFYRGVAGEQ